MDHDELLERLAEMREIAQPVTLHPLHSQTKALSATLYSRASGLYSAGDYALASNLYRAAFEADKHNVQALVMLGCCHYYREDYQTAAGLFSEALERAPFDPSAHYFRGMCYVQHAEYRRAVLCYRRALSTNPDFYQAWFALALAYDRLDMSAESETAARQFASHAPAAVKAKALQMTIT